MLAISGRLLIKAFVAINHTVLTLAWIVIIGITVKHVKPLVVKTRKKMTKKPSLKLVSFPKR